MISPLALPTVEGIAQERRQDDARNQQQSQACQCAGRRCRAVCTHENTGLCKRHLNKHCLIKVLGVCRA